MPPVRLLVRLVLMLALTPVLWVGLDQPVPSASSAAYERAVVTASNRERAGRDQPYVSGSVCLQAVAQRQATLMARRGQLFHQDLGAVLARCGLQEAGENVAFGYPDGTATTSAWMRSSDHRRNLLEAAHRWVGVGASQDGQGHWYVSQVLGRRLLTSVPAPSSQGASRSRRG